MKWSVFAAHIIDLFSNEETLRNRWNHTSTVNKIHIVHRILYSTRTDSRSLFSYKLLLRQLLVPHLLEKFTNKKFDIVDYNFYAEGVFQCKIVWYFLRGWTGAFWSIYFKIVWPFYAHDGQGQNRAHHGNVLDVGHGRTQEGPDPPCVGEKRR